ncbi:UDP-N-acetylmuramoyl-L-alanyl-D-glutamate--2,6-diaminopimelate ligase [Treponema putidum]|uniref:UDP-N-acetylmuramyl-tripeptide synthetase n=1 Tax=Treponema putidum TaxID=221027 RepID=A0ABY5HRF6_9SPIR|nr:UDP-N-acetylmuramoyl-L-alanyl-D-glutamate--2,6-diaminopimelate ligase [Treponema putidum]TWI77050.1 UDP-N-acetylmuramoylalanyl-D-glutamate--2,6-diaminopimelate ligase [Treponema putidum]UTY28032.1 UDP-N-acetylmuramoyl-L-alanyl-D-glutamate--2,6-diaminopimelate ligase [Treponema putidum]UTY30521.1 UDP-N-acetylmuramoyl-L-alanyl-D-glutamate--2,6-diaminopimelate ligase [Treponema putidum]
MEYKKSIAECIKDIEVINFFGKYKSLINSIEYDSRKIVPAVIDDETGIKKGAAFFALPGIHTDGKKFIDSAIKNGAVCVFYEGDLNNHSYDEICFIQVNDARKTMSKVSSVLYDEPSKALGVIGVTGTEGKSSTVSFIFQLLNLCGKKAGFFSTVEYSIDGNVIPNPEHQTTPESNIVQLRLAQMRDSGCSYAVVEASSHGLSPRTARLEDVAFDAAVFMNVTQEHLEFHGTVEQYRYDKANLFRALDKNLGKGFPIFGIVNYEDPSAPYFMEATKKHVYPFSTELKDLKKIEEYGGLFAKDIKEYSTGIKFTLCDFSVKKEYGCELKLAGIFNVKNILASVLVVQRITGLDIELIIEKLPLVKPVKGRMMLIDEGQDFEVLIDYAHTPSSFMTIFPSIKERIKKSGGRVISLFGSGGERDVKKRPEQGRIAALYSDIVILADEDPRGEDSVELLEMIAAGCPEKKRGEELFIIPDRPSAIKKAFSLAGKNDAVLLLGKGHENSIIFKDRTMPYDEETTARELLKAMIMTNL